MGKRMRRGPFNSIMDPTEFGNGSGLLELSEAVKKSGTYDAWAEENEEEDVEMEGGFGTEAVKKPKNKVRFVYSSSYPSIHFVTPAASRSPSERQHRSTCDR